MEPDGTNRSRIELLGGARRDRTDDLMLAKHALSQLSYGPLEGEDSDDDEWWAASKPLHRAKAEAAEPNGGPGTTRTSDLTLIRGAL